MLLRTDHAIAKVQTRPRCPHIPCNEVYIALLCMTLLATCMLISCTRSDDSSDDEPDDRPSGMYN